MSGWLSSRFGVVAFLLSLLIGWSSTAQAVPAEFKKPAAIVSNVAFWKKVYGDWSVNDIALHDEEDLGVIYRVVRVPVRGARNEKGQTRAEAISAARTDLETALKALQKAQPKDDSKLEGLEKQVYLALKGTIRPDKYARLSKIRGQNGLRERFAEGYRNSGLYQVFIEAELARNGLPKELIGIAFVESLFHTGARSKVGAAGIWQFMSYTGREYMQLNAVIDERWDPILATEAAAKYLKSAKKELSGEWPLAITSYNYGRAGMRGLARDAGTNDFGVILAVSRGKRFGFAARNYYASFLAVLEVLEEAPTRLSTIQKKPAWSYDVVRTPFPLYSSQITATGLVNQANFEVLNPALTDAAARGKLPLPHGISLRVPRGTAKEVMTRLNALPAADKRRGMLAVKTVHVCNGKQSVIDIAKKYSLAADVLAARTGASVGDVPAKGQKLPIPPPAAKYTLFPEARAMPLAPVTEAPPVLLLAEANLLPEPDEAADSTVVKARVARPATAPLVLTGVVKVRRVRSEALPQLLPAVDVVAGALDVLFPQVDVVAGVAPTVPPTAPPRATASAENS